MFHNTAVVTHLGMVRHQPFCCTGIKALAPHEETVMPERIKTWVLRPADRLAGSDADRRRATDPHRQAALSVYRSTTWQRLRRLQLAEFPLCNVCGDLGAHIDHITPLRLGGAAYDQANLQTLCVSCHSRKTRQEAMLSTGHGYN